MFDLEEAVLNWKKNLLRNRNMEESDVAELESHLRDETAKLVSEGLDEETAFRRSAEDPSSAAALDTEYGKVRGLKVGHSSWHPARLMSPFAWSHMKIALRKMRNQKAYSFINIVGLAFGMACSILIFFWVRDELSYNRFYENAGRVFRVNKTYRIGTKTDFNSSTPWPLAAAAREGFSEVQDATGFTTIPALIRFEDKVFNERRVCAAGPSFFRIFTFPFVKGDRDSALAKPDSIVVTESVAAKYFGGEEPLGKALTLDQSKDFIVSGVVRDIPPNSDIRYDLFVPVSGMVPKEDQEDWGSHMPETFVVLQPGADREAAEKKLSALIQGRLPEEKIALVLQPLGDLHLYSVDGSEAGMRFVRIFSVIAAFILAIACINSINLSTARSEKRAKEVGLRKVVGARRAQIAQQFFGESVFFTLVAFAVALMIVHSLRGIFHDLTGKTLDLARFEPGFLAGLLLIAVLTGLASGVYPALVLSSFRPVRAFRDAADRRGRKASFRKTLVVVQVALVIMLLIGTAAIDSQLRFIRTRDLGYDAENVLFARMPAGLRENYDAFRNELLRAPSVVAVARSLQLPGEMSAIWRGIRWEGMAAGDSVAFAYIPVDYDTLDLLGMTIVQGRNFSREFPADEKNFVFNEKAVEVTGLKDPVGKTFSLSESTTGTIVGVVKDFHSLPLNYGIEPAVLLLDPDRYRLVLIKVRAGNIQAAAARIESVWKSFAPDFPFEYRHLDERFGLIYGPEIRAEKIFRSFALVAVFLSCLGLLGLSSFTADQKTKEVGIRRTLGASVPGVVALLTRQFLLWVLLANVIAWPVAYFATRSWLDNYAFRTRLGLPLFLFSAAAALAIALLTVSFQAVKAALAKPVDSLRYE